MCVDGLGEVVGALRDTSETDAVEMDEFEDDNFLLLTDNVSTSACFLTSLLLFTSVFEPEFAEFPLDPILIFNNPFDPADGLRASIPVATLVSEAMAAKFNSD